MKKKLVAWWNRISGEVRQFVSCLVGVMAYKALDLAGERLDLSGLSFAFLGFAVAIALIITWVIDNDAIPKDATPEARTKILRRITKNAVLMGFFWQTVLSKLQELVEV